MALIAAILLNKRAAHRNYILDDTASNKDINYVTLLHLILWGTFKFRAKHSIDFCYWGIMSLIAIYSIFTQINELCYKLPCYKNTTRTVSRGSGVGLLQGLTAPGRKAVKKRMLELNFGWSTQQLVLVRWQGFSSSSSRAPSITTYLSHDLIWSRRRFKGIWVNFHLLFQLQTPRNLHSSKTHFTSASFPTHLPPRASYSFDGRWMKVCS